MAFFPPYGLFIIAEGLEADYISETLTQAWKGNDEVAWNFWLATDNYNDAPKMLDDGRLPEGTRAPVSSFSSPWVGKGLDECAQWLQAGGERNALNKLFFAAMDEYSKEDGTVMVCSIFEPTEHSGSVKLHAFPVEREVAATELLSQCDAEFDDRMLSYQCRCAIDGKPDRSRGTPFEFPLL